MMVNKRHSKRSALFLYVENHALDAWFCKAYGDEVEEKTPFSYNKIAVGQLQEYEKGGHS